MHFDEDFEQHLDFDILLGKQDKVLEIKVLEVVIVIVFVVEELNFDVGVVG